MKNKETILITGASGFIGKHFIDYFKNEYNIFGLARRSRVEVNIPYHNSLKWIQCDISNRTSLENALNYIKQNGKIDYILHFAAYYDFSYNDHPAYDAINVKGTENLLELSKEFNIKRFIFASSLAACQFPEKYQKVTEITEPNADYHYARSKKEGEKLLKKFSNNFPCSVVRLAAVYSDWCEFAPLYKFLTIWLSKKLESKILGGNGESAIPYIHVKDLCKMIKKILVKTKDLDNYDVYLASPDGSTSHKELFELATRYYYGESINPVYLPKLLAYPGLIAKHLLKYLHITCEEPFERFWMIKYIDRKLEIDASETRQKLDWDVTPRYHIKRRLLFLLEKKIRHQDEWTMKNEEAMKRIAQRTNLIIYEKMIENKDNIIDAIISEILNNNIIFTKYREMEFNEFHCFMSTFYHLLLAAIRSNDRSLLLKYIDDIAIRRFAEGFEPDTLTGTLKVFNKYILNNLNENITGKKIKQDIFNSVSMSIQIAQDEIEDLYDELINKMPVENLSNSSMLPDCKELQRMIRQLSAAYQITPDEAQKNPLQN